MRQRIIETDKLLENVVRAPVALILRFRCWFRQLGLTAQKRDRIGARKFRWPPSLCRCSAGWYAVRGARVSKANSSGPWKKMFRVYPEATPRDDDVNFRTQIPEGLFGPGDSHGKIVLALAVAEKT